MTKGIAFINRGFRYQIHATDRRHDKFGTIIVDTKLDDLDAKITIFESGTVLIESPKRRIEYHINDGSLLCD
jgi:hypothetical protein